MKSMNRVQLIGWLGKDISVKIAKNGSLYGYFRMATDRFHKDAKGGTVKKTSWHTVWVWDPKKAAACQFYLTKGSHVLVEGILNYRDYTGRDGIVKHLSEIKATTLVDLDR
ncbi:MAG TPA: single-stranded DNA-binding protein [Chitinophagaceae bacterium]|nr:single-stranded DNA-binding protein [Chitinophagaceae bacterium]